MAYLQFNSNNNLFLVRIQADDITGSDVTPKFRAYRRSKTMMTLISQGTLSPFIYVVTMGIKSHAYYSDGTGILVIPIKGWIDNLGNSVAPMSITKRTVAAPDTVIDTITMNATSVDGVSYDDISAPIEKGVNEWSWTRRHDAILPPNVMYSPPGGVGVSVEANMTLAMQNGVSASMIVGGSPSSINPTGIRRNELLVTNSADAIQLEDKTAAHVWVFDRGGDCLDMAVVHWLSMTGAWRTHYFPVVGYLRRGEDQTSLVTSSDGYLTVRGATLGVRCRIDGLTPYSVWYYADLLQASEVHASMEISPSSLTDDLTAVNIEEGDADVALINGFYSFEFTIKLKQYDKV